MSQYIDEFLNFWRKFDPSNPPFIHPDDRNHLTGNEFESQLLPLPVIGDLRRCDILILMLNPGLNQLDYEWEKKADFTQTLRDNITQNVTDKDYPLFYLDPRYAAHPGADYWYGDRSVVTTNVKRPQRKLYGVIERYAMTMGISIEDARRIIAQRVAILQLFPYHSKEFKASNIVWSLPSCQAARRLAQHITQDKLVIITRAIRYWGYSEQVTDNLVVYPPSQARSASLSPHSPGGAAILRRLSVKPKARSNATDDETDSDIKSQNIEKPKIKPAFNERNRKMPNRKVSVDIYVGNPREYVGSVDVTEEQVRNAIIEWNSPKMSGERNSWINNRGQGKVFWDGNKCYPPKKIMRIATREAVKEFAKTQKGSIRSALEKGLLNMQGGYQVLETYSGCERLGFRTQGELKPDDKRKCG